MLVRKDVLYKLLPYTSQTVYCPIAVLQLNHISGILHSYICMTYSKGKGKAITNKCHRDGTSGKKKTRGAYVSTKEYAIFSNSHFKIFTSSITPKLSLQKLGKNSGMLSSYKLFIPTVHNSSNKSINYMTISVCHRIPDSLSRQNRQYLFCITDHSLCGSTYLLTSKFCIICKPILYCLCQKHQDVVILSSF